MTFINFFLVERTDVDEKKGGGIYYIPSDHVSSWKTDPDKSENTAYGVIGGDTRRTQSCV